MSMRKIKIIFMVTVFLLSSMVMWAGGEKESEQGESVGDVVKIGFFSPVTGPAAADGESSLNSAKLAVEKINQDGGINGKKVELVNYDDHLSSDQAVNIAQKLTTRDEVSAVVSGSYSGPTRSSATIYQNAGVPMVASYAVHPDIPQTGDYIFQQHFSSKVQGRVAGYIALEKMNAKKIAILFVDNDFGHTITEHFEDYLNVKDAEIVFKDSFSLGEQEFNAALTKIKNVENDLIFMVAYPSEGASIVRRVQDLNINSKLLGTQGVDSTKQFLGVAGEAANGLVITTNLDRDSEAEIVKDYIERYKEKYNYIPDMVGASTYDAFMVLAHAMRKRGTTPQEIKQGLNEIKNLESVTGTIFKFNENGEVIKPVQIQIVKDEEFHYYDIVEDMELIIP